MYQKWAKPQFVTPSFVNVLINAHSSALGYVHYFSYKLQGRSFINLVVIIITLPVDVWPET